jgi:peptide-methionine (S)-S-oxide reductase
MQTIEITFDPAKIGFGDLWRSFATHDPTTINRQNDVGTQYRSEIFYHNEEQKKRQRGLHWFNDR